MYGKNKGLKPRRYEIYLFIEKKNLFNKRKNTKKKLENT